MQFQYSLLSACTDVCTQSESTARLSCSTCPTESLNALPACQPQVAQPQSQWAAVTAQLPPNPTQAAPRYTVFTVSQPTNSGCAHIAHYTICTTCTTACMALCRMLTTCVPICPVWHTRCSLTAVTPSVPTSPLLVPLPRMCTWPALPTTQASNTAWWTIVAHSKASTGRQDAQRL